jgi:Ser/Thr protein kinase RdoA (MazF antagonist)
VTRNNLSPSFVRPLLPRIGGALLEAHAADHQRYAYSVSGCLPGQSCANETGVKDVSDVGRLWGSSAPITNR